MALEFSVAAYLFLIHVFYFARLPARQHLGFYFPFFSYTVTFFLIFLNEPTFKHFTFTV